MSGKALEELVSRREALSESPGKPAAMAVPFYRPKIDPDEISEVLNTLQSGWLTTGSKAKQFAVAPVSS